MLCYGQVRTGTYSGPSLPPAAQINEVRRTIDKRAGALYAGELLPAYMFVGELLPAYMFVGELLPAYMFTL